MSERNVQLHSPYLNCADPYHKDFGGIRIHRFKLMREHPTLIKPSGYNPDVSEYQQTEASWDTDSVGRPCSRPRLNCCADVLAPCAYYGDKKSSTMTRR